MPSRNRILFVSTMGLVPWGGSEELWSRTALDLVSQGFSVSANVIEWSPVHPRVLELKAKEVELRLRPRWYSFAKQPLRRMSFWLKSATVVEVERQIAERPPALIVASDGGAFPQLDLLELCVARQVPFVTISQANFEGHWLSDEDASRYRAALPRALRCFFVSRANLHLAEKQIGDPLPNGEVVWNPFNVSFDATPLWPPVEGDAGIRFASVGRLHPPSKGQDILLEALAGPVWKDRRWCLNLYGEGPMRQVLERLVQTLNLTDRVFFGGFTTVEKIWATNHVLVMPSRYEGLPLAMVEAMLCARPVIATDVAGHAEIVDDGVTGFLAGAPTVGNLSEALERFWERREEAEAIGTAASRKIRRVMPSDPVRVFSDRLRQLAGLTDAK
jgi:glycosyltransferase involved in cell wall biosynthesis